MSTVGRPTVEPETYQGTVLIRGGQPGQYVRVRLEDVAALCVTLQRVAATQMAIEARGAKAGPVADDLEQPSGGR